MLMRYHVRIRMTKLIEVGELIGVLKIYKAREVPLIGYARQCANCRHLYYDFLKVKEFERLDVRGGDNAYKNRSIS